MKVVITGANGMVARAVKNYCNFLSDEVVPLTRTNLDISNAAAVSATIADLRPDAVINCAAYTDVDGAEARRVECFAANADGVGNLAEACASVEAVFVTVSTDYVFDGSSSGFYTQRDTPNPLGVYAKAKREGEIRAFAAYPRSIIVRSGWIYGHGGTNFLSVMPRLLADGKPIRAICDSHGTPTYADDLARRLRELAELDLPAVFHVANSGPGTSYFGFAEKVCEIGAIDKALVASISNDDLQRPAPRPASSKLACLLSERVGLAPMPEWDASLRTFLNSI